MSSNDSPLALGLLLAVGAVLAGGLVLAQDAEASHFRAGTMQWNHVPNAPVALPSFPTLPAPLPTVAEETLFPKINLTVEVAFRRSYTGAFTAATVGTLLPQQGPVLWGDGASTTDYQTLVTAVDIPADTIYTRFVKPSTTEPLDHSYPIASFQSYEASWTSSGRLRYPSGHINNPDRAWRLETLVNLSSPNYSPVATLVPIRPCPQTGVTCTFTIFASDPDNDPLSFRFSTPQEATNGATFYQPGPCPPSGFPSSPGCSIAPMTVASASIDPVTGVVSWLTTGATVTPPATSQYTYYSIQVMVEDGRSRIPLDFFIRLDPPQPPPTCGPSTQTVQIGQPATFTGTNNPTWASPGGSPPSGSGNTYSTTYSSQGTYTVTVSNSGGSATCTVVVAPPPLPPTCIGPGTVPAGSPATFTASLGTGVYSWSSAGSPPAGLGPTYTTSFAASGTYTITVTSGTDSGTCTVEVTPVAMFDVDPVLGCVIPFEVHFTDLTGAGIAAWSWQFGDGGMSTAQNPVHFYASEGTYTVTLTVTDGAGLANTATQTVTIALHGCPSPSQASAESTRAAGPPRDGVDGGFADHDLDGDGVDDRADNCAGLSNPAQADLDLDGLGDACDGDADADGVPNEADNCLLVPNAGQADLDQDLAGDACDGDRDGDAVEDGLDNCPGDANADQADQDRDGQGDACTAGRIEAAAAPGGPFAVERAAQQEPASGVSQAAGMLPYAIGALAVALCGAVVAVAARRRST